MLLFLVPANESISIRFPWRRRRLSTASSNHERCSMGAPCGSRAAIKPDHDTGARPGNLREPPRAMVLRNAKPDRVGVDRQGGAVRFGLKPLISAARAIRCWQAKYQPRLEAIAPARNSTEKSLSGEFDARVGIATMLTRSEFEPRTARRNCA